MKRHNAAGSSFHSRGFTLLELLLACAVFAVLAGALYGVFSTAMRLREKGQGNFERGANEEAAMAILRRDLMSMVIPAGTLAGPMLGKAGMTDNESDALEFYAASGIVDDDKPWGDVQKVSYALADSQTEDSSAGGQDLVREVTRNIMSSAQTGATSSAPKGLTSTAPTDTANAAQTGTESDPEEQHLLDGVESLHFQYLDADGSAWEETWDSAANDNTPPAAVKVDITFAAPADGGVQRQPLQMVCEVPVRTMDSSTTDTASSTTGAGATP